MPATQPTATAFRNKGNLRSIYMMLAAVAMFSVMDTVMKMLAQAYPAMQVAALRGLCSLPLVVAYVAWRGQLRTVLKVNYPLHLLRGALGIGMLFLFAYGVRHLSLAQAYTIFFVAPALITALSVVLLREKVDARRWAAIVVGLLGVIVVMRPSGEGMMTLGALAILGAALGYAVSAIAGRVLARTDSSEQMVFWLMLMVSVGASALAWRGWMPLQAGHAWLLVALSVTGFIGQLAITEAFGYGEPSRVAPFEYTALAWGVAIDLLLWNVLPDFYTLLGAAIIIASGVYLIRHEKQHAESDHP